MFTVCSHFLITTVGMVTIVAHALGVIFSVCMRALCYTLDLSSLQYMLRADCDLWSWICLEFILPVHNWPLIDLLLGLYDYCIN